MRNFSTSNSVYNRKTKSRSPSNSVYNMKTRSRSPSRSKSPKKSSPKRVKKQTFKKCYDLSRSGCSYRKSPRKRASPRCNWKNKTCSVLIPKLIF